MSTEAEGSYGTAADGGAGAFSREQGREQGALCCRWDADL